MPRRAPALLVLLALAAVPALAAAHAPSTTQPDAPTAAEWRAAAASGEPLRVGDVVVRVRENRAVLAPGVPAGEALLLEGEVLGAPGGTVRVAVVRDVAQGIVFPEDHTLPPWPLPFPYGSDLWKELDRAAHDPVAYADDWRRELESVPGYLDRQVDDVAQWVDCLDPVPTPLADARGLAVGWSERTLDVAFTVDATFVAARGGLWAPSALAIANALDGLFQRDADLRVRVVDLHAHDAATLGGSDFDQVLEAFAAHYAAEHADVPRDLAHLFTGVSYGNVAGQATCIGVAGEVDLAYSAGRARPDREGRLLGEGPVVARPPAEVGVAAHEIAHLLGAHHHYANCAETQTNGQFDPRYPLGACTLMANDVALITLGLSTANRLIVRGLADDRDL